MKSISTLILAIFLLIPLQAQDKVYTVDNLPKVHLQNKMQPGTDTFSSSLRHDRFYALRTGTTDRD